MWAPPQKKGKFCPFFIFCKNYFKLTNNISNYFVHKLTILLSDCWLNSLQNDLQLFSFGKKNFYMKIIQEHFLLCCNDTQTGIHIYPSSINIWKRCNLLLTHFTINIISFHLITVFPLCGKTVSRWKELYPMFNTQQNTYDSCVNPLQTDEWQCSHCFFPIIFGEKNFLQIFLKFFNPWYYLHSDIIYSMFISLSTHKCTTHRQRFNI